MARHNPASSAAERKAKSEGESVAEDKGDTKKEDYLEKMKAKKSKRGK